MLPGQPFQGLPQPPLSPPRPPTQPVSGNGFGRLSSQGRPLTPSTAAGGAGYGGAQGYASSMNAGAGLAAAEGVSPFPWPEVGSGGRNANDPEGRRQTNGDSLSRSVMAAGPDVKADGRAATQPPGTPREGQRRQWPDSWQHTLTLTGDSRPESGGGGGGSGRDAVDMPSPPQSPPLPPGAGPLFGEASALARQLGVGEDYSEDFSEDDSDSYEAAVAGDGFESFDTAPEPRPEQQPPAPPPLARSSTGAGGTGGGGGGGGEGNVNAATGLAAAAGIGVGADVDTGVAAGRVSMNNAGSAAGNAASIGSAAGPSLGSAGWKFDTVAGGTQDGKPPAPTGTTVSAVPWPFFAPSAKPAPAAAASQPNTAGGSPTVGARRRPPPGTPRQPRPEEVGRTEYFTACPSQGIEYQTILRVHRRAILCGTVRKCSRSGASSGQDPSTAPATAQGGSRAPAWLLLSGGEDGYVLWDLGRGRPLLVSLEEEGDQAGPARSHAAGATSGSREPERDRERRTSVTQAVRAPGVAKNLAAFKQFLSMRRPVARDSSDEDEDEDEEGDGSEGGRDSAAGGSAGAAKGGVPLGAGHSNKSLFRTSRQSGNGSGDGSDSDEQTAAAWQGASYRNMITCVAFISDTTWATCHPGGAIRVWQADASYSSASLVRTLHGHTGYINNIASYGDGRFAITTGLDTTARTWDLVAGREVACFRDHENEVTAVAVMETGRMALTTAEVVPEVASAMLWDPSTGKLLHTLGGHHGWLFGVALSDRRKIAVAIGEHATLFIWNTENGDLLLSKVVANDGLQRWCSINSDGNFLTFGSAEGVVRVVETYYGCELARFDSTWVDQDFHSISACFFCDDELHDSPEHWNNKFLSLQGDSSDITRLFRPQETSESSSARTISTQEPRTSTKGSTGIPAASALSTVAWAGLGASVGTAGGNKSIVRSRMVHSVRAAAALAAIGRAAAAGGNQGDSDEDEEDGEELIDGEGKDAAALAAKGFAASPFSATTGAVAANFAVAAARFKTHRGNASRKIAPLPAQLERVTTDRAKRSPVARSQSPPRRRSVGKATRFADVVEPATALRSTASTGTGAAATSATAAPAAAGGAGAAQPSSSPAPHPHLRFALPDSDDDSDEPSHGRSRDRDADEGSDASVSGVPALASIASSPSGARGLAKLKSLAMRSAAARGGGGGGDSPANSVRYRRGGGGGSAVSRPTSACSTASGVAWGGSSRPRSAGGALGSLGNTSGAGSGAWGVVRSSQSGNLHGILGSRNATELEMSPFGRRIVSLSGDGTVRVWSLLGVSVRRELPRHPEMVNEVAISPDRSLVATVTENEGCLRLFSLSTGRLVATVAAHIGFDCDGVALSDDARLISHDPFTNACEMGGLAVTCSDDTTIRVWDLSRKGGPACVRVLHGHAGGVTGVCWVPGSTRVLSVGEDRCVVEWDVGPGGGNNPVARMDHVHEDTISAVLVSPDARRALTCSSDRTARLWQLTPPGLPTHGSGPLGRMSVAGNLPGPPSPTGGGPALAHAAAAAAAAAHQHQQAGGAPHMPPRPELHRFVHDNSVTHGAFSPDGRHVVTCGADCSVRLWDADNGKQLVCFEGHSRTVTRCVYLNSYVVATAGRDGTIRCWDMQRKRRLPTLAPPFALEGDSFEAMLLLPSQRSGYGFPELLASLTSGRVVVYDPTYRQPLPEQLLLQLNPELELLGPPDVEDLVVDFPGLLVLPIRDGNTMLHMAAMSGDAVLLRALLAGISGSRRQLYGNAAADASVGVGAGHHAYGHGAAPPPLPLNFAGQTPLDLAVAAGHRRCAELLLGTELARPPEQRLAVLRAWHSLAVEMPSLLVSFLKALSLDPAGGMEEDVLFAPLRANDEVMTLGSEDLDAEDLWFDHITQLREDLTHLPWYAKVWPVRQLWDFRDKPTSPSVAGLPYVAMSARNMEHSPLGVLVQHGLSQALASDVMYAVLFYKWETFARAIFIKRSVVFIAFLVLYLVASTMSVLHSPRVEAAQLYDFTVPACVIRMVLEAVIALMALHDIYGEVVEVVNAGWYMYLAGSQGSWNGFEMSSCVGILLTFGLQFGGFDGGSRFAMSFTTILLGFRLLKVASGPEHTGVFVQALLRIVSNLRFFMLILLVLVLTFSIAFWQIMSFDLDPGETNRSGKDFDTLGNSIVKAYAYGVIGQMNADVAAGFSWRPWVQVLMLTYTFLITVILLNLLVAVMSDTYSVVKEHARSEWLLLRAKLILEIESSLPDAFFKDTQRCCPRWLHCLKVDTSGGRRGDETLIESLRGPTARHVLNTDLNKTEARLAEELRDVRDTLRLLHADVGNVRSALVGAHVGSNMYGGMPYYSQQQSLSGGLSVPGAAAGAAAAAAPVSLGGGRTAPLSRATTMSAGRRRDL